METQQAKVSVSFKDGVIEISGPENFVSEQVRVFRDIIGQQFSVLSASGKAALKAAGAIAPGLPEAGSSSSTEDKKPSSPVYTEKSGRIIITKRIPGADRQERIINTTIVYLWINLQKGIKLVPLREIRQACNDQQCLDRSNFAKIMKKGSAYYSVSGQSRAYEVELNENGQSYVQEILQYLN